MQTIDSNPWQGGHGRAIMLLTLLALVLRAAGMDLSFSGDDFGVVEFMGVPSLGGMIAFLKTINYAPAYPAVLNLICNFGTSEVWTRVPGVLFGVACVPLVYVFVARMLDRDTALVTAGLVAVSQFHIDQALQLKPMTLYALETLMLFYALERWIVTSSRAWLGALTAVSVALLYTHYFSIYLFFFEGLVVLVLTVRGRAGLDARRFGLWAVAQVVAAVLYVPWLTVLYGQLVSGALVDETPSLNLVTILPELALTFTVGYTGVSLTEMTSTKGVDLGAVLAANAPIILLWLVTFVPASLLAFREAWRGGTGGRLLLGFVACTLLLPLLAGLIPQVGRFSPKLVIGASFGTSAALALAVTRSPRAVGRALGVLLILVNALSLFHFYASTETHGRRADWRGAFERVQQDQAPGDLLAIANTWASDWYHQAPPPVARFHHMLREAGTVEAERERVARVLEPHVRVWFFEFARFDPEGSQALALAWLREHRVQDFEQRYGPMLVLYRFSAP